MKALGVFNPSEPSTFIRCWDTALKIELKLRTMRIFPDAETVRQFITRQFRNLEYREHAPWDDATHGGGILYAVPVQNVLFEPPRIDETPERRRFSVLIDRKRFPRNPILKGA